MSEQSHTEKPSIHKEKLWAQDTTSRFYDELVSRVKVLVQLPEEILGEMSERERVERDLVIDRLLFEVSMRDSAFSDLQRRCEDSISQ